MCSRIILGVDPGFSVTGYGVLKNDGNKARLIDFGYLKLPVKNHLSKRVGIFYQTFESKIQQHKVTEISLETPFLSKNVQTFLKLGYLRGILYLLADQNNLSIKEFSPREVKSYVTGHGGASKQQVAYMITKLFPSIVKVRSIEKNDVTDAIAVCLSGYWHKSTVRI